MMKRFYANGKLLITGEYLVMFGAKALAVPLKLGQWMDVYDLPDEAKPVLKWEAKNKGKTWFQVAFYLADFYIIESSSIDIAARLLKILSKAIQINGGFPEKQHSYKIITDTSFDINWGMGSSSSLITLIAAWLGIDAFMLFAETSQGSGFDIACAVSDSPILFQRANNRPKITPVIFHPDCREKIFFIYLGRKQESSESIRRFIGEHSVKKKQIDESNRITENILVAQSVEEFKTIIKAHENLMAAILQCPRIKETRFPDFDGEIKSLGAWGGDFAMIVSSIPAAEVSRYFTSKGISPVFQFNELI